MREFLILLVCCQRMACGGDDGEDVESQLDAVIPRALAQTNIPGAICCINADSGGDCWKQMEQRFQALGILHRVRRFDRVDVPSSTPAGSPSSHRRILEEASRWQLDRVLVFEDDVVPPEDCLPRLKNRVDELKRQPWYASDLFGFAIAYHRNIYPILVDATPLEDDGPWDWIARHLPADCVASAAAPS